MPCLHFSFEGKPRTIKCGVGSTEPILYLRYQRRCNQVSPLTPFFPLLDTVPSSRYNPNIRNRISNGAIDP